MTLLESATNPRGDAPAGVLDTVDARKKRSKSGTGDQGHYLPGVVGSMSVVRTENQIRPHTGFAQSEVMPRTELGTLARGHGVRTMQLSKPPEWTTDTMPCLVPSGAWTRDRREKHWDTIKGRNPENADKAAKAMCGGCPVLDRCLADALEEERGLAPSGRYLVRGGLTPRARAALDPGTKDLVND